MRHLAGRRTRQMREEKEMTLLDIIRITERIAQRQPSVNMIVRNDVFRINEAPDRKYGIFAWLQNDHTHELGSALMGYSFTFFYVDRLREDRQNELEVQSVGILTLTNILETLRDKGIEAQGNVTFHVFNQRFADECAGAFCTVTLDAPVGSVCADLSLGTGDYDKDFNKDFLIY